MPHDPPNAIDVARRCFWTQWLSGEFDWGEIANELPPILSRKQVTEEEFDEMLLACAKGRRQKKLDAIGSHLMNLFAQRKESVPNGLGKETRVRLRNGTQIKGERPAIQTGGNFGGGA